MTAGEELGALEGVLPRWCVGRLVFSPSCLLKENNVCALTVSQFPEA